jgi:hypothetical protein
MEARMPTTRPQQLTLVYANWCPYCNPLSLERAPLLAERLGVPLRLLDIDDRPAERAADALVQEHGDWDPDYLIPQVFLEWTDGSVTHLLTGVPGPMETTRRLWELLIAHPEAIAAGGPSARAARAH